MDEWVKNERTLAGVEAYGRAFAAASAGDFDAFGESIVDLYNNEDYYGDGLQIVRNKSGFTTDEAGNVVGARVTFKDSNGRVFTREWGTIDQLLSEVAVQLSPEAAFQAHLANKAAAPQAAAERRQSMADRIADTYEALSKEYAGDAFGAGEGIVWSQLTEEEKQALVRQRIAMEDALLSGGAASLGAMPANDDEEPAVPPLRRPG